MTDIKDLGIGMFIAILLVGGTYLLTNAPEGYKAYQCNATEPPTVGFCWKLSKVNEEGLQTRCYWNDSSPLRYKRCDTGWFSYTGEEVIGEDIILEDYIDNSVQIDYLNFINYTISELRCNNYECDLICIYIYGKKKSCKKIIPLNKTYESLLDEFKSFGKDYERRVNLRKSDIYTEEKILIIDSQVYEIER